MRQAQLHDLSVCGLLTSAPRSFFFASFFSPFRCFHPLPCAFRFAIGCGRWGCTRLLLCWLGVFAAFYAHQRWLRYLTHQRIACFCLSSVLRVWSSSVVALKLTVELFRLRFSLFFLLSTVLTLLLPKWSSLPSFFGFFLDCRILERMLLTCCKVELTLASVLI